MLDSSLVHKPISLNYPKPQRRGVPAAPWVLAAVTVASLLSCLGGIYVAPRLIDLLVTDAYRSGVAGDKGQLPAPTPMSTTVVKAPATRAG